MSFGLSYAQRKMLTEVELGRVERYIRGGKAYYRNECWAGVKYVTRTCQALLNKNLIMFNDEGVVYVT